MEFSQALGIGLGVILTAIMAAIGWLIRAVIHQGNAIAAIRAATEQKDDSRDEIRSLLRGMSGHVSELRGDFKLLFERSDWVQRTIDRHERFLEAGRLDGGE